MRLALRFAASFCIALLFALPAVATPTLSVNPTTIARSNTGSVQIDVGNLSGSAVVLRLYVDANGNGVINTPDDTLIWSDVIEDNGGEWSPNMFVDSNMTLGTVTVDVQRFTPLGTFPYTTGNFVWQAEDSADMSTQTGSFSITQAALAQSVSGIARDGVTTLGVPGALILSLPYCDQEGGDQTILSTFSDQNGDYTIQLPDTVECRDRIVLAVKPGYNSPFAGQPSGYFDGTTQLVNQDPTLNPASSAATGRVEYATGSRIGQGIPGLLVVADSADGLPVLSIAFTDANGDYTLWLNDGDWEVGNPEDGIDTRGVVYLSGGEEVNISGSGVSVPTLSLPAANAFYEGTVRDAAMMGVGAHFINAFELGSCDPDCHEGFTYTRADGSYTIGVVAPAGPATAEYEVGVVRALPGLVGERLSCEFISATQTLTGRDLDYQMPTSFVSGNVFDESGDPVSGACLQATAYPGCTSYVSNAQADCDGHYDLPVIDGFWNVEPDIGEFGALYGGFSDDPQGRQLSVMNADGGDADFVLDRSRLNPLIRGYQPAEPIAGQHAVIFGYGFSLGSDPQVFFDALPATIVTFRPDKGAMVVEVPPTITPGPHQITVVNTDLGVTSDPACIEIGAGSFAATCTISGTITSSGGAAADVLVIAEFNDDFNRVTETDSNGDYTLNLEAAGTYQIDFQPPAGTSQIASPTFDVVCGTTQDYLLVDGFRITGRTVNSNFDAVSDAPIEAEEQGGSFFDADTVSDTEGLFSLTVSAGTYTVFFGTPPNSRQLAPAPPQVVVAADVDLGPIVFSPGVMLVGRVVDESGDGLFTDISVFDRPGGIFSASTLSDSCTGSFSVGVSPNEYGLQLENLAGPSLQPARVEWIDLQQGDQVSPFDFVMASTDVTKPITNVPQIQLVEPIFRGQQGQPIVISATRLGGTTVDVQFTNGAGGFVNGLAPVVDASRGFIITRVPAGVASGGLRVQVDGVNSALVPFTLEPGLFSSGGFTASGTVSGLGGVPTIVVVDYVDPAADCEDDDLISDYAMTDAAGNYGPLSHPGGDISLFVVAPQGSTLAGKFESRVAVASNVTIDTTLAVGIPVSIRVTDESLNPIEDARLWSENEMLDIYDERLTDSNGDATLYVETGDYRLGVIPPPASRLLELEDEQTVNAPLDFGDQAIPAGRLVGSAVLRSADSTPLAGATIEAQASADPFDFYHETFSDINGLFRGPVEEGAAVRLDGFSEDPELTNFRRVAQTSFGFDTISYPALEADPAGLVAGVVNDQSTLAPVAGIFVAAIVENPTMPGLPGFYVDGASTCDDGSFRIKLPEGSYFLRFLDFNSETYVDEWFSDALCSQQASLVSVTEGGSTFAGANLERGGTVRGSVLNSGAPLPFETVCANSASLGSCATRCTTTDESGAYSLVLAPASDYVIQAFTASFGSPCYLDDPFCNAPTELNVVAETVTNSIDFNLGCVDVDLDMDGWGFCSGDCDDSDPNNYPGNTEVCDGQDNDCNGLSDDADGGVVGAANWYDDSDMDGAGDSATTLSSCAMPAGFVSNDLDCDPANGDVYPAAPELNDGIDNQCDGDVGFGAIDELSGDAGFVNVASKNEFSWPAQAGATDYRAMRSTSPDFSDGSVSFETVGTVWDDPTLPSSGTTFYYMARASAPMDGSWGLRSDGLTRRANVLLNGDVERWQSANNLETWIETGATGLFEQEMDPAHVASGQISARMTRTNSGVLSLNYYGMPVDPGVDYTLKMSAKFSQVESNAVQVRIFNLTTGEDLQTDGSWAVGGASFNFALTTDYQELTVPFTVDPTFAGSDQIRMIIRHRFTTSIDSILWLDDIRIEE